MLKIHKNATRIISSRIFSTHQSSAKLENDWQLAKPFSQIPKLSAFTIIRRMLPGGKYHDVGLQKMQSDMKKELGDITVIPSMMGRPEMVLAFNPEDFEKVFRNEGQYPTRHLLETLDYYRRTTKRELYAEYGSLFTENGPKWHNTRTLANPIMMKPQTIKLYLPQIDDIAKEFIQL